MARPSLDSQSRARDKSSRSYKGWTAISDSRKSDYWRSSQLVQVREYDDDDMRLFISSSCISGGPKDRKCYGLELSEYRDEAATSTAKLLAPLGAILAKSDDTATPREFREDDYAYKIVSYKDQSGHFQGVYVAELKNQLVGKDCKCQVLAKKPTTGNFSSSFLEKA